MVGLATALLFSNDGMLFRTQVQVTAWERKRIKFTVFLVGAIVAPELLFDTDHIHLQVSGVANFGEILTGGEHAAWDRRFSKAGLTNCVAPVAQSTARHW